MGAKTRAERIGYHVAWRKRMVRSIRRDLALFKVERAELQARLRIVNTAILTMERMLIIRFDDLRSGT